ncbi:type I polyketide synthase [Kitasatospora viridis]|uniref:Acyl transferase domain-containing protein n=1 Tax=Kitasatospora viridis TaxID=281105 RepID=A0A561TSE0_9ACTN|nr:type I polyketide synthase [Kitasatospora viridis]TWF90020.1 acyl transferase domain-containing protein [Kitasatospora viridis]
MHFDRPSSAIAVVGMSGRFPGAKDVDALWRVLEERRETVATAPADRAWMRELHDPEPRTPGRIPTDRGGFLPGIDRFDGFFFDMSPREAQRTDPQLRLLLETAHEVLEDACMPRERLADASAGVFVGANSGDYLLRHLPDLDALDIYSELGTARSVYSGKLSYALGLDGPSLSVDTACSSSLLAVHLACESLRAGECEVALAGGVNLILTPHTHLTFGWAGGLSPDGSCKFADASANGFVRSEAVGLVLLKPLDAALADGDRIRAVILGSATNNNGFTGNGLAAPSRSAQVAVLRRALRSAGRSAAEVDFVEAHGTGTPLGDRVELAALGEVLAVPGERETPCLVGSVKTNLGHTEAAAGITGLIKAVLCMERRRFPGNPHLLVPNPDVDWRGGLLRVPADTVELAAAGQPLLAGVNSFGVSGSNVHLVLESAPVPSRVRTAPAAARTAPRSPVVLPLAARSGPALAALADRYRSALRESGDAGPAELCRAAAQGRTHWERRLAVTGGSAGELAEALAGAADRRSGSAEGSPRVVFVFPGQGSQWLGMGRELLDHEPVFRATLEKCEEIVGEHAGWSLLEALRSDDAAWQRRTSRVQPALWAVGVALADLWRSWGIEPAAVVGQSQGEIAAAYCAGALSLAEAGRLSCVRAELLERLAPPGAMARIGAGPAQARALLAEFAPDASVAVEESGSATVVAGAPDEIGALVLGCEERGIACRSVKVAYAAHSARIDPVRRPLGEALRGLAPTATRVPFLSTVTGAQTPGTALDAAYWWRNLRETVRLDAAVRAARGPAPTVFLEVSPHPLLTAALDAQAGPADLVLGSLWRDEPERLSLYGSLGRLYEAGADVDWSAVQGPADRTAAPPLPRYPWQRERHWYQAPGYRWPEIGAEQQEQQEWPESPERPEWPESPEHPLLGDPLDLTGRAVYLMDHQVGGTPVLAGAALVELLLAQAAPARELVGIEFTEALPLAVGAGLRLRAGAAGVGADDAAGPGATGPAGLVAESRTGTSAHWVRHARAAVGNGGPPPAAAESPAAVRERGTRLDGAEFYRRHSAGANSWGGAFAGVREIWLGPAECLARVAVPPAAGHLVHPVLLDACMQPVAALLAHTADADAGRGFVLSGIDRVWAGAIPQGGHVWSHVRLVGHGGGSAVADITISDEEGNVVMAVTGVRSAALTAGAAPTAEPWATEARGTEARGTARADAETFPGPVADRSDWVRRIQWHPVDLPTAPSGRSGGNWLLLGADGPLGRRLARALTRSGAEVTQVAELPGSAGAVRELLDEAAEDGALDGVIALWTSPVPGADEPGASSERVQEEAVRGCAVLSTLVGAVASGAGPVRLYAVTRGAQQAPDGAAVPVHAPWRSALWGLGLVAGQENPGPGLTMVDLDPDPDPGQTEAADAARLAQLVLSGVAEPRVALRGTQVLAPRLDPAPAPTAARARELVGDGGLTGLELRDVARPLPGPGEVEIEVSHAGLNFHDVLALTGTDLTHPAGPPKLGCESAGTVTAVGEGVGELAVGDRVLAFAYPALRSHVLAPAALVRRRPDGLGAAEAAALPAAHATAYHALVEQARLAPGECVLIHSATGGVGLAAIDIARMCGATVYATAGTPAKRSLLRQMGVAKVGDSRSTRFAEEFRDPDDPERGGVDVVLGTQIGDAVEANFGLLNPFGRYVDLAVNDIAAHRPLPMGVFTRSRCYLPVNLVDLYEHGRERLAALVRTVTDLVAEGLLAPPAPRVFPVEDAAEAFALLARSGHTGKVVLSFPTRERAGDRGPVQIRPGATYLVTGGLSGVGGLASRWLAQRGAGHLLLTGRTPESALAAADPRGRLLAELRATGTQVEYAALDAADESALAALLERRRRDGLPAVAGAVHSAVSLQSGPADGLTAEELRETFGPKVAGGWALHRALADEPLDFFTLFSSAVSVLGGLALGHHLGAYAAANAFTDALAAHRLAQGLPATVVNWGYWSEVGLAARLSASNGHDVRPRGMFPLAPDDAPRLFDTHLTAPGRHLLFPPADWNAYLAAYPQDKGNPLLAELAPTATRSTPATAPVPVLPVAGPQPPAPPQRPTPTAPLRHDPAQLTAYLKERLSGILGMRADQIDAARAMNRFGLDSLMATQLRSGLRKDFGIDAPLSRLMGSDPLSAVAAALASEAPGETG